MATRTPDNPSRRTRSSPLQQELSCTGSPRFSNSVSAHASTSVICDSNSTFTSNSPLGSSPPSFRLSSSPRSSIFGSSPQPSISGSSSQSSISGSSSQSFASHSWPPSPSPKSSPQSDTDNNHVEEPICNARPGKRKFDTTPTKTPSRHPAPPNFVSPDFCPGSDTDGSSFEQEDNCRSQPSLQAAAGRLRAAKSVPNLIISEEHSPLDIERPETLPRSGRDPGQQRKTRKRSDSWIDLALSRLILNEGKKAIKPSKDIGSNYVFKATRQPDNRPIFKVGRSVNAPENRSGALRRRCKLKNDEFLAGSELPEIRMYKMAEKLILMELTNFVIREKCPGCGGRHREYLRDVDEEHLLKVHRRWHAFCRVEPWGEDGRLKKRWSHRLDQKQKKPLPAPARAGYNDPDAVARAWQAFVRPTMLERLELEVKIHALSARHLWCETRPYLSDGFSAVLAAVILWPSLWALAPPCLWLVAIVWWAVDPEEIRSFAALPGYLDPPGRQAVFFESGEEALPAEDGEVGAEELYREISGREKTPGAWPV